MMHRVTKQPCRGAGFLRVAFYGLLIAVNNSQWYQVLCCSTNIANAFPLPLNAVAVKLIPYKPPIHLCSL